MCTKIKNLKVFKQKLFFIFNRILGLYATNTFKFAKKCRRSICSPVHKAWWPDCWRTARYVQKVFQLKYILNECDDFWNNIFSLIVLAVHGEFPYQVSIQKVSFFGTKTHYCGGAVVGQCVVTAVWIYTFLYKLYFNINWYWNLCYV